jgi:hypothetical protein
VPSTFDWLPVVPPWVAPLLDELLEELPPEDELLEEDVVPPDEELPEEEVVPPDEVLLPEEEVLPDEVLLPEVEVLPLEEELLELDELLLELKVEQSLAEYRFAAAGAVPLKLRAPCTPYAPE